MTRLLFVHSGGAPSSFVAQDLALLRQHAEVTPYPWTGPRDLLPIRRALRDHDATFGWFLSHHTAACALLARLSRRRSVAVLGGIEPAPPDLTGGARSWKDEATVRYAYNHSDLVLAVSRFTLEEGRALRRGRSRSEVRLLPNGVDTARYAPQGRKEDLVLTVAGVDRTAAHRKRLGLFVAAAALVPEVRFVLAGAHLDGTADALRAKAPKNLEMPGQVDDAALLDLYRRAKVYVQASLHESFGMANAEAMACEAVPVVAARGALPEVVGDAGFVVPEPLTPVGLAGALRRALASDLGPRARQRIRERYPLHRRGEGLRRAVEDALAGRLQRGREVGA